MIRLRLTSKLPVAWLSRLSSTRPSVDSAAVVGEPAVDLVFEWRQALVSAVAVRFNHIEIAEGNCHPATGWLE
jgi:hypothetical protein